MHMGWYPEWGIEVGTTDMLWVDGDRILQSPQLLVLQRVGRVVHGLTTRIREILCSNVLHDTMGSGSMETHVRPFRPMRGVSECVEDSSRFSVAGCDAAERPEQRAFSGSAPGARERAGRVGGRFARWARGNGGAPVRGSGAGPRVREAGRAGGCPRALGRGG